VLRLIQLLCAIVMIALSGSVVFADDDSPEHNALLFAARKDWQNAQSYANQSSSTVLKTLISWEYALDADSGASFDEITQFIADHPNWPDQKKLRLRAEMSLHTSSVEDQALIKWFDDVTPVSGTGKIALAHAYERTQKGSADTVRTLVREAWHNGDFDEPQEQKILDDYGSLLTKEDHAARINRLLWEDHTGATKRIMRLASDAQQKLFKARIALQQDKSLAVLAVAQVPSSLKHDPGLIYDRMMFRARRDDDNGVREMLYLAPAQPPYPEKWWHHREYQVRRAIDKKQYSVAKKLLDGHGQIDGEGLADATWLEGWLKTEFMNDPKSGFKHFTDMYEQVRYPVSKARAAYWAGRAAEKSGDTSSAKKWYKKAVAFPTTFYGQLALLTQDSRPTLDIPASPSIGSEARSRFAKDDVAQAIKLCISEKQLDSAAHLIAMAIENSDDEARIAQLSELGNESDHPYLSVHAAKKAMHQDVILIDAGYPTPKTPAEKPIEPSLTLAITRQESEFNARAQSPSGALGMMQLLPGTAKEIAKKHGIGFSAPRLYEPEYNMTLGSLYLARLISSYDGSYILAIASYNAGPGHIHDWMHEFGTPNNDRDNAVNWIEKIPFRETRNYVQRILENLQVYRHITSDDSAPALKLGEDLVR